MEQIISALTQLVVQKSIPAHAVCEAATAAAPCRLLAQAWDKPGKAIRMGTGRCCHCPATSSMGVTSHPNMASGCDIRPETSSTINHAWLLAHGMELGHLPCPGQVQSFPAVLGWGEGHGAGGKGVGPCPSWACTPGARALHLSIFGSWCSAGRGSVAGAGWFSMD